jgi:hypothetical protein
LRSQQGASFVAGLHLGSSHIRAALPSADGSFVARAENAAVLALPMDSSVDSGMLTQMGVAFATIGGRIWVLGRSAFDFDDFFVGHDVTWPLLNGFLTTDRAELELPLRLIVDRVIGRTETPGTIAVSVPSPPIEPEIDADQHARAVTAVVEGLGHRAHLVDEGLAVVLSEQAAADFTGVGMRVGAGRTHICAACFAEPVVSFSIPMGGDWLDEKIAEILGITSTQAEGLRRSTVDLARPEGPHAEVVSRAHRELVTVALGHLRESADGVRGPVDVVLAGSPTRAKGFDTLVSEELAHTPMPFAIGSVRRAEHPELAVVRGCLTAAHAVAAR